MSDAALTAACDQRSAEAAEIVAFWRTLAEAEDMPRTFRQQLTMARFGWTWDEEDEE
jgi:hypothetical protein